MAWICKATCRSVYQQFWNSNVEALSHGSSRVAEQRAHVHCTSLTDVSISADLDAMQEEQLEELLGTVDGMDLEGNKRVWRPTVLDLKSAVEAAEQQSNKRLKAELPELASDADSQRASLPQHYYEEPDPAK